MPLVCTRPVSASDNRKLLAACRIPALMLGAIQPETGVVAAGSSIPESVRRAPVAWSDRGPVALTTVAMNACLGHIGIEHAEHRNRAIDIGERLRVLEDYPTSPGCTSPFAPVWIAEMVRRQREQ